MAYKFTEKEIDTVYGAEVASSINSEYIPNIRPHGHACNALQYPDNRLFVCWYAGSYEGAQDHIIAGAIRDSNGKWRPTEVIQDNFNFEGDLWMPEIGVPVYTPSGEIDLFFFGWSLSSFSLRREPL